MADESRSQFREPHQICEDFKRAWNDSVRPPLAEALDRWQQTDGRSELLENLLLVEIAARRARGEQPTQWEYYPKFPGDRQTIDRAFRRTKHDTSSDPDTTSAHSPPSSRSAGTRPAAVEFNERYRLDQRVGGGAFGDVYRATDTELRRSVAIKILRAKGGQLASILREAQVAASLKHPAIVTIHDFLRTADGSGAIVMEYIHGSTLAKLLEQDERQLPVLLEMLSTVADALKSAHMAGLVHRDLKPANILVDERDQPFIADFGLALHEIDQKQRTKEVSGTPAYMAPEQIRGETHLLDGRCDIWAFGVMLYEALTGKKPFGGRTRREVFDEIQRKPPRPPRMIENQLPQLLEEICLKCLAKDVNGRYTNAGDVAEALRSSVLGSDGSEPRRGESDGLLSAMWEMLDPDLQDAFSLAYNKKRRLGKDRISTRDLFQALGRIQDKELAILLNSLPQGAMPKPLDPQLTSDQQAVVKERPLLSDCVRESLTAFQQTPHLPRKISPTDLFVDIGKHGHGPSVQKLREHGVEAEDLDARVDQLHISILHRSSE